jgi:hypothetical protein
MLPKITFTPKHIFLLDSLGALLSAFLLGVALPSFQPIFGMPHKVLYGLAALACLFAIYSSWNYIWFRENWRPYLRAVAIMNLLYCGLTAALVVYFRQELTKWGLLYFLLEMLVIIVLVVIEFQALARKHEESKS